MREETAAYCRAQRKAIRRSLLYEIQEMKAHGDRIRELRKQDAVWKQKIVEKEKEENEKL